MRDSHQGRSRPRRSAVGTRRRRLMPASLEQLEDRLAPSGDLGYALSFGGIVSDQANEVATDSAGNIYVAGQFQGTPDLDPNPATTVNLTSAGGTDAFLAKFSPSGSLLWAQRMGGTGNDRGTGLAVDVAGDIVLAGEFNGTANFGALPSLVSAGSTDAFVAKLDSAGNFLWAKRVGGTGADSARDVAVDAQRNVLVVGDFTGTADFDPGAGTANRSSQGSTQSDVFVLKLDSAGTYTWAQSFGASGVADLGQGIAVDGTGNVYTTGIYRGVTNDFDPGAGTVTLPFGGMSDVFASKLSSTGDLVWAKGFGASQNETATAIAVDAAGNAFLTGTFAGTVDFNPNPAATFNLATEGVDTSGVPIPDVFVVKLNASGDLAWAGQIGGQAGNETVADLTLDIAGNVYLTGTFIVYADFDPDPAQIYTLTGSLAGPPSAVSTDAYVLKLGNDGHFLWASDTSGFGTELPQGITTDAFGHVYVVGGFIGTSDFDPDPVNTAELTSTPTAVGGNSLDAFLLQFSSGTVIRRPATDGYAIDVDNNGTFESVNTAENLIWTRDNISPSWRGLLEYDLTGLDAGLSVLSATLTVNIRLLEFNNIQNGVDIGIYGYAGDGTLTPADATTSAILLGQAFDVDLGTLTITLDATALQTLLASSSKPGLVVRLLRGDGIALDSSEWGFNPPPTLALEFGSAAIQSPRSRNDIYYFNEDATSNVPLSAGVLDNDDTDRAPLTATLVTGPQRGNLVFNSNGTFSFTPPLNYNSADDPNPLTTFTYRANDGTADGNLVTVFLLVNPVNDAPVAVADSYTTNEDVQITFTAPSVLTNDTDIDTPKLNLTASLLTNPSHGTLNLFADGTFIYRPAADYHGPDSFTYRAYDGQAFSDPVTVSITVRPVNDAPEFILVNATATSSEDAGPSSFASYITSIRPGPVTAVDETGQVLHFEVTVTATTGGLTFSQAPAIAPDGTLTFTTAANANGTATIRIVLVDDGGTANGGVDRSTARTGAISVTAVDDPPTAGNDSYSMSENASLTVTTPGVVSNDTDFDGTALTALLVTAPAHGSLALLSNGGFTYTPDPHFSGFDSFTYSANDGLTSSSPATVTIEVVTIATILDNGSAAYSQTGAWTPQVTGGFGGSVAYTAGSGSTATATATWEQTGLAPGSYEVRVTWLAGTNRASNAPYRIYDGNTLIKTVRIDQRNNPAGVVLASGAVFQNLGTVAINNGTLRVELGNDADGFVIADAVRLGDTIPFTPVFVDDGKPGYNQAGPWVSDSSGYGGTARYVASGDGSAIASWQYTGLVPGSSHDVQVTWIAGTNRASNAPYRIYDGNTLIKTVRIDQRNNPFGVVTAGGAVFQNLGSVAVTGTTLRVELGNDADGYVIADAIRLSEPAPFAPYFGDDGQLGYNQAGPWVNYSNGYGGTGRYVESGDGSAIASWQHTGLVPGSYEVQVTWMAGTNRATNAPYRIYDGNTLIKTVRIDQRNNPAGAVTAGGAVFQTLGTVAITGTTLRVELGNDADGFVIADAVRLSEPVPFAPVLSDDGQSDYNQAGPWVSYSGGYGGTARYVAPGGGSDTASWQYTGLVPGSYEVQVTWIAGTNRASNAPYRIYDGNTLITTVRIDQRNNPAGGTTEGGVVFQSLGTVVITGNTLRVELGNDADGFVIADAMRISAVSPLRAEGGANPLPTGPQLKLDDLPQIVDAALARWRDAGADDARIEALRSVPIRIADLAGDELGFAGADGITIDRDAAGYGWFVDPTPDSDSEFTTGVAGPAAALIDLLSVLEHEFGHLLGFGHSDHAGLDDLMAEALRPGVRRTV
ncbi:tandem-95 repeat protein [Singulisphaera sp. Ch08]|uniref:Tandem-95 repeat protein n=1 Tax=Singulisphaera sp. Ch08 TaxID=3120278 RepID=A0AAU7CLL4_9BACT